MGRVQDRVAVVTGGANGLGQAIACRLAEEGARLVLGDLDAAGLERTAAQIMRGGGAVLSVVGDLTEEAPAARLMQSAVEVSFRRPCLTSDQHEQSGHSWHSGVLLSAWVPHPADVGMPASHPLALLLFILQYPSVVVFAS